MVSVDSLMLQLSHQQALDEARGLRHLPYHVSSPVKIAPIGRDPLRTSHQQHSSVPELKISSSLGAASSSSFSDSYMSSIRTLSCNEYLWRSPSILSENMASSSAWASSVKGCCLDNNWQYKLDLEKIWHEADKRTTLMIKNIPNK